MTNKHRFADVADSLFRDLVKEGERVIAAAGKGELTQKQADRRLKERAGEIKAKLRAAYKSAFKNAKLIPSEGGKARAKALSPERRSEIARKAVEAREKKRRAAAKKSGKQ